MFPFLHCDDCMAFFLIPNDEWSDDGLNRSPKLVKIVNCSGRGCMAVFSINVRNLYVLVHKCYTRYSERRFVHLMVVGTGTG